MIVGIKIESCESEVSVAVIYSLPVKITLSFSFPPSLLLFQLWQPLQLLSVEQIPAVACGVCLSVLGCLMAEDLSSSVANSTVSCSTRNAFSKPVPAKEHVCVLLCLCCNVSTAHPGVQSIQSWTTSLTLAGVS